MEREAYSNSTCSTSPSSVIVRLGRQIWMTLSSAAVSMCQGSEGDQQRSCCQGKSDQFKFGTWIGQDTHCGSCRMTAMLEEQLWWSILCIFRCLLCTNQA